MDKIRSFSIGRSGCPVSLINYHGTPAVLKENLSNVSGILDIYHNIKFPTPTIYEHTASTIIMEYIDGLSMLQYLAIADEQMILNLVNYISSYFDYAIDKNSYVDCKSFIDGKIKSLSSYGVKLNIDNSTLLCGLSHGDFTFDNLIFKNGNFYMIDLTPSAHSGIHFDANKLRQDLSGYWFARNEPESTEIKVVCDFIYAELKKRYSFLFDDDLYRFMFARVLPYCKSEEETKFILDAIGND